MDNVFYLFLSVLAIGLLFVIFVDTVRSAKRRRRESAINTETIQQTPRQTIIQSITIVLEKRFGNTDDEDIKNRIENLKNQIPTIQDEEILIDLLRQSTIFSLDGFETELNKLKEPSDSVAQMDSADWNRCQEADAVVRSEETKSNREVNLWEFA